MTEPRVEPDTPPYWSGEINTLVQRRGTMPDVQRWQSTYVRYQGQHEGQVTQNGWELTSSPLRNREETMMNLSTVPSMSPGAALPHAIQMRIISAPAEFAVPVKQDRRLTPDFKIRVDVRYRGRVNFPLTIRAHILSQQEKDNLPEWRPEGMADFDVQGGRNNGFVHLSTGSHVTNLNTVERRAPTELKGTTYITQQFESNIDQGGIYMKHDPITHHYQSVLSSSLVGGGAQYLSSIPHVVPSSVIQTPMPTSLPGPTFLPGQEGALVQGMTSEHLFMQPTNAQQQFYSEEGGNVYPYANQMTGEFADGLNYSHMMHDLLDTADPAHLPPAPHLQGFDRQASLGIKTEHYAREYASPSEQKPTVDDLVTSNAGNQEQTLTHEFEFSNLEFLKPTRMSKVYICFACTILDCDLLYCVYHIPTVGICRAEQRIKASDKLGIPMRAMESDTATDGIKSESSVHYRPSSKRHHDNDSLDMMRDALAEMDDSESRVEGGEPEVTLPYSRQALRDWILEEYESTGLKRRLTELDLQTLESQAGFPIGGGPAGISLGQWNEFTGQFCDVLSMLKRIAPVWNTENPCVISGLHLDRRATVQALQHEPAGTFVCRLSLSMPGTLVLSCKVRPDVERADNDGLIHAIIRMDDLQERRVDTWIRDFPSASHVLDVYTQKRVDKRKVFHTMYMRMKHMEDMFNSTVGPPSE